MVHLRRVRSAHHPILSGTTILMIMLAPLVHAQDAPTPAYVAFVDGHATLERDGQAQPAAVNAPFVAGDRLRTTTGRVEVLFPDGTALDVDEYSAIDLQSGTLLRLLEGRALLVVAGTNDPAAALRYQIDTPAASVRTEGPGEYRLAITAGREAITELAVLRGSAVLETERGSMPIRAGERSVARDNEAPSFPRAFNSARFDAFDRWASARRDARTGTRASAPYLPPDLQMYAGTFDQHGTWQYTAPHGYVWYPHVMSTWQPYYNGYWTSIRQYGWTWIGHDVWAWPTHHYGRWGISGSAWFWAPANQWAPAWVSWGATPGYVSWCPLGFDNRPVLAHSARRHHPWSGWVTAPRSSFGRHRDPGHRYARAQHLSRRDIPFVRQAAPPLAPRTAAPTVPNGMAAAARMAAPSSPRYDNRSPNPGGSAYVRPPMGDIHRRGRPVDVPVARPIHRGGAIITVNQPPNIQPQQPVVPTLGRRGISPALPERMPGFRRGRRAPEVMAPRTWGSLPPPSYTPTPTAPASVPRTPNPYGATTYMRRAAPLEPARPTAVPPREMAPRWNLPVLIGPARPMAAPPPTAAPLLPEGARAMPRGGSAHPAGRAGSPRRADTR